MSLSATTELAVSNADALRAFAMPADLSAEKAPLVDEGKAHSEAVVRSVKGVDVLADSTNSSTNSALAVLLASVEMQLTDSEPAKRGAATALVACALKSGLVVDSELGEAILLQAFVEARLQDYYCTEEALLVVAAIVDVFLPAAGAAKRLEGWLLETVILSLRSVFGELSVPALPQLQRYIIFWTLDAVLHRGRAVANAMAGEFVLGFLQCADSEKDPRCLVLALRGVAGLLGVPGHDRFLEDIFELLACYFPVTFRGSAASDARISRNDIVDAVRDGLAATPRFAPYAIPFFLEKLETCVDEVAGDVLDTLAFCAEKYGPDSFGGAANDIYSVFRTVCFPNSAACENQNADNQPIRSVRAAACSCWRKLVALQVSSEIQPQWTGRVSQHGQRIFALGDTAVPLESESETISMESDVTWFSEVLAATASVSEEIRSNLLEDLAPTFANSLDRFSRQEVDTDVVALKPNGILDSLAVLCHGSSLKVVPQGWLKTIELVCALTNIRALRTSASMTLVGLISTLPTDAFTTSVSKQAFLVLKDLVVEDSAGMHGARIPVISALVRSVTATSSVFEKQCAEQVVGKLAQDAIDSGLQGLSQAVASLCAASDVWISTLFANSESSLALHLPLIASALETRRQPDGMVLPDVLLVSCRDICSGMLAAQPLVDYSVIAAAERFVVSVALATPREDFLRQLLYDCLLPAGLIGIKELLSGSVLSPNSAGNTRVLCAALCVFPTGDEDQQKTILQNLLEAMFEPTVPAPELITTLWDAPVHCCVAAFAALVNRSADAATMDRMISEVRARSCLHLLSDSTWLRTLSEDCIGWTARALAIRSAPSAITFVEEVVLTAIPGDDDASTLTISRIVDTITRRVGGDRLQLLSRQTRARVAPMHEQRFFCTLLPRLLPAPAIQRAPVLSAISVMVENCPIAALVGEISKVFPVLMTALSRFSATRAVPSTLSTVLRALAVVLAVAPANVLHEIERDIGGLAKLIAPLCADRAVSVEARIAAVRSALLLTRFPYHVLYPVKEFMLTALHGALDDNRRSVRLDASRARNAWLMLSSAQV